MSKDLRNTLIAVALFVALAGTLIYFVTDTQAELDLVTQENTKLEEDIDNNNKEIAKAPGLKRELEELQTNFRDYVKILPSAELATEEKLLKVVQSYCDAAQVRLDEIIQRENRRGGSKGGEFVEVGVSFRILADFDSFVRYLNLLERHEQFLKVNTFAVSPSTSTPRVVDGKEVLDLSIAIEVTTYKYVAKK